MAYGKNSWKAQKFKGSKEQKYQLLIGNCFLGFNWKLEIGIWKLSQ